MADRLSQIRSRSTIVGIVLCAVIGAIACSVVPVIPEFIPDIGRPRTAESGGLQTLVYFVWMTWENIVYSPWGILGALAGASIGWVVFRPRPLSETRTG